MKTDEEFRNLKWVRIFDPLHIPREYVEQIKDRKFSVEKFFRAQAALCVQQIDGNMVLNPLNLLWVLVEENNTVKGFCWMVVDALSNSLVINTFSMDKEYWGNGKAVRLLEEKAIEIQKGAQLDRVYWITRCPKHSEKYGFKRSKHTIMEYVGYGRDNDGQQCEAGGASQFDDPGTVELS